ncbi:MAG: hypothetical protein ACKOJF_28120 [Planctomycetaceae bacterium]
MPGRCDRHLRAPAIGRDAMAEVAVRSVLATNAFASQAFPQ